MEMSASSTSAAEMEEPEMAVASSSVFSTPPPTVATSRKRLKASRLSDSPVTRSSSDKRKCVRFDGVSVYLFQRTQGFGSVPSFGGHTIGMSHTHSHVEHMPLTEHEQALQQVQERREQQLQTISADEEEVEDDESSGDEDTAAAAEPQQQQQQQPSTSFANDEQLTAEHFKIGAQNVPQQLETDEESEEDEDEVMAGCFFQPLSVGQRRQLLTEAGIDIDRHERHDCEAIRESRQVCGCSCIDECLPETCECATQHIQCQVDRPSFPCGCTTQRCANPFGRVEFNPLRVRSHHIQTMMRLRLANRTATSSADAEYFSPPPKRAKYNDEGSQVANASGLDSYCSPLPAAGDVEDNEAGADEQASATPAVNGCGAPAAEGCKQAAAAEVDGAAGQSATYSLSSLYPHAVARRYDD